MVRLLTVENEARLDTFFGKLQAAGGALAGAGGAAAAALVRVKSPPQVDGYGKICVKYSRKTDESILAKAVRPARREVNPRVSVEHVRDTFRFKAVVFSFRDALSYVFAMDQSRELCPPAKNRASGNGTGGSGGGSGGGRGGSGGSGISGGRGGGLSPTNVAKLDIAKLTKPKEWGWRFLALDFIMPNRQVSIYSSQGERARMRKCY
jgi:hypothetical protein